MNEAACGGVGGFANGLTIRRPRGACQAAEPIQTDDSRPQERRLSEGFAPNGSICGRQRSEGSPGCPLAGTEQMHTSIIRDNRHAACQDTAALWCAITQPMALYAGFRLVPTLCLLVSHATQGLNAVAILASHHALPASLTGKARFLFTFSLFFHLSYVFIIYDVFSFECFSKMYTTSRNIRSSLAFKLFLSRFILLSKHYLKLDTNNY